MNVFQPFTMYVSASRSNAQAMRRTIAAILIVGEISLLASILHASGKNVPAFPHIPPSSHARPALSRNAGPSRDIAGLGGTPGILGTPRSSLVNINNVSMWASDNGMVERRPGDLTSGVTFPRGTATVVYAGGLLWCGKVSDGSLPVLRAGGQTYNYGTVPGRIIRP